jgi:signal transduction histidine kinase
MDDSILFKKPFKYVMMVFWLSFPIFLIVYQGLRISDQQFKKNIISRIENETGMLATAFDDQLKQFIREIGLICLPKKNPVETKRQVQDLVMRHAGIHHINYFSADGKNLFTSNQVELEWEENLLNKSWYRQLIKNWQPTVSSIHQSPVSPFPMIISIAIPAYLNKKIDGFWLIYYNINMMEQFFPTIEDVDNDIHTVWFDSKGKVIKANSYTVKILQKNKWWYNINDYENSNDLNERMLKLEDIDNENNYLFASQKSAFDNVEVLVVHNTRHALASLKPLKRNLIILSIIVEFIIALVAGLVLHHFEKQKIQLKISEQEAAELQQVNVLLKSKTEDLRETNQKLDRLTHELSDQRENLLKANNDLNRFKKYLDFLTAPVIAINEHYDIIFMNRATEHEFFCSREKYDSKPLGRLFDLEEETELFSFLQKVKKESQRHEFNLSLETKSGQKHYLLICDYLSIADWQGFILTMTDLTVLLNLQKNIKEQNHILDKSHQLIESFLHIGKDKNIVFNALRSIREYTKAKAVYFYQVRNNALQLEDSYPAEINNAISSLPLDNSVAGGTLMSGKSLFIEDKALLPRNMRTVEKKMNFKTAYLKPVIINKNGTGVLIILNPEKKLLKNHEKALSGLLSQFEIGLSAIMTHEELNKKKLELEQSATFRAQLLRSATHGMNTPLSTVKGYVKLLKLKFDKHLNKYPDIIEYMNRLDHATSDMAQKIHLYLDLARINRNALKFNPDEIFIHEFLEPVLERLDKEARARSVKLTVKNTPEQMHTRIMIDTPRFIFAIQTLCLNAICFSPANDQIRLSIDLINDKLQIEIEDHGPEIKKEHIDLIGSEYLPEELTTERIQFQNDLNMSLAVKLLRLSGGNITVNSCKTKTIHLISIPVTIRSKDEKSRNNPIFCAGVSGNVHSSQTTVTV